MCDDHLIRRGRAALVGLCAVAAALLLAAPAGAHAFLVRSSPAAGAEIGTPPTEVRLVFDEPVKPAPGITVVRAGGHSVVAGKPYVPAGRPNEIVIPLRRGLGTGPYAVRWSEIDEDDGHLISGAFIFAVGSGLPPTQTGAVASTTSSGGSPPLSAVISRWLLLAGLLVAAGSVGFGLAAWRPVLRDRPELAPGRRRADAVVLTAALALATLGAFLTVALEAGSTATRFGRWTSIGGCVAAAATAAALASLRVPRLRAPAAAVAVVLLGLPTATGHASASDVPHGLSIPADVLHLAAAAFWVGGVLELAVVAPLLLRRHGSEARRETRRALAHRFTPYAAAAVVLLGATGVVRAVNELAAFHQLWTTGYGQALLVKTGLLVVLLALGWSNRVRVRLPGVRAELALLAVVVGAVAVLTNLRPGLARGILAAPAATTSKTVVFAGQDDDLAVGLAVTPGDGGTLGFRSTVLGLDGPAAGLRVHFVVETKGGRRRTAAAACGAGCYRATLPLDGAPSAVAAEIAGKGRAPKTLRFAAPSQWPAPQGLEIVRRSEQAIRALKTLVVHSRLASDPEHEVTTIYRMVAPNRLAYHNVGGSDSVIVGDKRWDRQPGGRWVESPQWPPIRQPSPFWPEQITDAHVLRTEQVDGRSAWVVTFLDPATPAWFTAWIDRESYRTLRLEMIATAHFMHDRNGPFNAPVTVEPPGA
ncbi:MAG TPA: copper resistance protein CopC [Gaiellaceae bacterium]|nr:copper resistance protein CopC [Gaiellaceae bacterium]